MMYAVYNEDGRITQASQVYDPNPKTEEIMRDLGQTWIKRDRELVSADEWYVLRKQLARRRAMPIKVTKTTIHAGGNDSAIFCGIPRGAACAITTNGNHLYDFVAEDDELELLIPVPCVYTVQFCLWPFQDAAFAVEAVA